MQRLFRLRNLLVLITIAIVSLGVVFRSSNLSIKTYWGDEVYSALRIFGHSTQTLARSVATGDVVTANDLLKFQRSAPGLNFVDTVKVLAKEDSHLPPLYFLLSRFWANLFGDSIVSLRSFSVVLSLVSLPCFYWLAMELFGQQRIAWMAVILAVVSPVQLVFAQEARFYSLWLVTTLLSSLFLLRALRLRQWRSWGVFCIFLIADLYTQFLSILTLGGFGLYLLMVSLLGLRHRSLTPRVVSSSAATLAMLPPKMAVLKQAFSSAQNLGQSSLVSLPTASTTTAIGSPLRCSWKTTVQFGLSAILGCVAFTPWLWIYLNRQRVDNRSYREITMGLTNLLRNWFINFSRLFIDFNWDGQASKWRLTLLGLITLGCLVVTIYALYRMCRENSLQRSGIVLSLILTIPIVFTKLALEGSLPPRYLLPTYAGLQLGLAYLLGSRLQLQQPLAVRRRYSAIAASFVAVGLLSCATYSASQTWWNKQFSNCNIEVARIIQRSANPLVISDGTGETFFDHGLSNILSLAHSVPPQTAFQVGIESQPFIPATDFRDRFVLTPSTALRNQLKSYGNLQPIVSDVKDYRDSLVCLWRFD